MILEPAVEAELVAALAFNLIYHAEVADLDDVLAVFSRAPPHALVQVGVLLVMPVEILFAIIDAIIVGFIFNIFQKEGMRHHHVTSELCALCEHTSRSITIYLVFEIHLPTVYTELVAAGKGISFLTWVILIEFEEADLARVVIVFCFRLVDLRILFYQFSVVFEADSLHLILWHREPLVLEFHVVPLKMT